MAIFEFRAKDLNGIYTTGRMEALDEEQAWWDLRVRGLYPVKVKPVERKIGNRPLRPGKLALFSRQISVMLRTGVPLVQGIQLLGKKEKDKKMKALYLNLYDMVSSGTDFSDALKAQKGAFPPFLVTMFQAGEMNGRLYETAQGLKEYYEREDRISKKLGTAMVYPAFLFSTMMAALYLIFTRILPEFFSIFEEVKELPVSTKIVIAVSGALTEHILLIPVLVFAVFVAAWYLLSIPALKLWKDRVVLHLPFSGRLFATIATARFARTFGFLYGEGVPVMPALDLSSEVVGNTWIKQKFKGVMDSVCDGMPLSLALESVKEFDGELLNGIYIGEETGQLSLLTGELAQMYDREAETATERLAALVEPVLIVLLGILMGFVALSVMIPIYQYYKTIG